MTEEYGSIREEGIDLMHDIKPMSVKELLDDRIDQLVEAAVWRERELQNLIDFILYPHTHEEITTYANSLRHRLMEEK